MAVSGDELNSISAGLSRREGPRLQVETVLNGRLVRGNLQLNLVDLGFGGFAIESPIAFTPGSEHSFRFTTNAGVVVTLRADAVYARRSGSHDGMDHYVAGFKYRSGSPADEQTIDILIDAANSPLTVL